VQHAGHKAQGTQHTFLCEMPLSHQVAKPHCRALFAPDHLWAICTLRCCNQLAICTPNSAQSATTLEHHSSHILRKSLCEVPLCEKFTQPQCSAPHSSPPLGGQHPLLLLPARRLQNMTSFSAHTTYTTD